jgi:3-phosphoshikimate 1-carboxyvinyltransferase
MRILVSPGAALEGATRVPGDKSIAHRLVLLASVASGRSELRDLPEGLDVAATARACAALLPGGGERLEVWVRDIERRGSDSAESEVEVRPPVEVEGSGRAALRPPRGSIDCGNSGTTMRLLAGVLAASPFGSTLDGDGSLRARPMERVADPLRRMGAEVQTSAGRPPVVVRGGPLSGIRQVAQVPSAQVKGAVVLAGIAADGRTEVVEPVPTRDHTERILSALGGPVRMTTSDERGPAEPIDPGRGSVPTPAVSPSPAAATAGAGPVPRSVVVERFEVPAFAATVPGDVSSAAFLCGAALLTGGAVTVTGVGLNPSRLRFLEVLARMGARVDTEVDGRELDEPLGTLRVTAGGPLTGTVVPAPELPDVIDEIPLLAVVAAAARGETRFEGAGELRVKESDRLTGLRDLVRGLGGNADVDGDALVVGGGGLEGLVVDAGGDHRMAMAAVVGALAARRPSEVRGAEAAAISYPGFAATLLAMGARLEILP